MLEKEQFGGQITITHEVVNYPGIGKTSGKQLTETMQQQAEAFGAEFLLAEATGLDLTDDVKTVRTGRGDFRCFGVLLATGAHPRMVGFKGEAEHKDRGVAYCATCVGEFFTGKEVFVVGGGGRERIPDQVRPACDHPDAHGGLHLRRSSRRTRPQARDDLDSA